MKMGCNEDKKWLKRHRENETIKNKNTNKNKNKKNRPGASKIVCQFWMRVTSNSWNANLQMFLVMWINRRHIPATLRKYSFLHLFCLALKQSLALVTLWDVAVHLLHLPPVASDGSQGCHGTRRIKMNVRWVTVTLLYRHGKAHHSVFLLPLPTTHCCPKMRLPNHCALACCQTTKGLGQSQKIHFWLNTVETLFFGLVIVVKTETWNDPLQVTGSITHSQASHGFQLYTGK